MSHAQAQEAAWELSKGARISALQEQLQGLHSSFQSASAVVAQGTAALRQWLSGEDVRVHVEARQEEEQLLQQGGQLKRMPEVGNLAATGGGGARGSNSEDAEEAARDVAAVRACEEARAAAEARVRHARQRLAAESQMAGERQGLREVPRREGGGGEGVRYGLCLRFQCCARHT